MLIEESTYQELHRLFKRLIDSGWIFGVLFGLHFLAVGMAWVPLFTRLREAFGQQTTAICGIGPAFAAGLTLVMFIRLERLNNRLNRVAFCAGAEFGMGVLYLIIHGLLTTFTSDQISAWFLFPIFSILGMFQSSANTLISTMVVTSNSAGLLPRVRAMGSLTYAIVAFLIGNLIPLHATLPLAALTSFSMGILCLFLMGRMAATALTIKEDTTASERNHLLILLLPLLLLIYCTGAAEQFYNLYSHQFATYQFGKQGTILISLAVLLEIVILFVYPKQLIGNQIWLLMAHPIAWSLLFGLCGYGSLISPYFAAAMILQGFNCAGVVLVQRKVGMHWHSVSGQAAVTFSQGAGWLTANFLDAFVLSGNQKEVWQTALYFALAAVVIGFIGCLNYSKKSQKPSE